jgi:preprotein translocase subunit SecA
MSVLTKVLKAGEGKKVRRLAELVPMINALEDETEALDDEELAHKTVEFKERLDQGETLDDLLIESFAVVREAAWRVLGQRHFDVQLMGGMALHFGWIAEMKTGEGKTLVSTLPVYLNALGGQGVHLVTVNDYLATRDAAWMGRLHRWLGLSVGRVGPDIDEPDEKRAAYQSDITYGTNTEFGFDYLRDNMARSKETMVQRGHSYAIIDEVDSILIDEARTPLIISGPADEAAKLYYQFASVVRTLNRDVDYEVDEEKKIVVPSESGIEKVEHAIGIANLYDAVAVNYVHQLNQALRAKELYQRDKDYLVDQGEVKIVDEFTGRTLDGRRWSDGLHQAVEAKERVRIKEENHTWATVTLQNYFRLYEKLAGMTGTAETEASEFASTYSLPVVPIPTNRELIRADEPDLVFKSEAAKFAAVVDDLVERSQRGQPVLVGTASVAKSELLSRLLSQRGVKPRWSRRPADWAQSPSPPTWPAEGSTSSSAAIPSCWPVMRSWPAGSTSRPRKAAPSWPSSPTSWRAAARAMPTRCVSSGVSTCSAASATRAGASTTSCGDGRAARAIPERVGSSSAWKTT